MSPTPRMTPSPPRSLVPRRPQPRRLLTRRNPLPQRRLLRLVLPVEPRRNKQLLPRPPRLPQRKRLRQPRSFPLLPRRTLRLRMSCSTSQIAPVRLPLPPKRLPPPPHQEVLVEALPATPVLRAVLARAILVLPVAVLDNKPVTPVRLVVLQPVIPAPQVVLPEQPDIQARLVLAERPECLVRVLETVALAD